MNAIEFNRILGPFLQNTIIYRILDPILTKTSHFRHFSAKIRLFCFKILTFFISTFSKIDFYKLDFLKNSVKLDVFENFSSFHRILDCFSVRKSHFRLLSIEYTNRILGRKGPHSSPLVTTRSEEVIVGRVMPVWSPHSCFGVHDTWWIHSAILLDTVYIQYSTLTAVMCSRTGTVYWWPLIDNYWAKITGTWWWILISRYNYWKDTLR